MAAAIARDARLLACVLALALVLPPLAAADAASKVYATKSNIKQWVDPATPSDRQVYTSSRGRKWELVMSDEFNTPKRSFKPGSDHLWTSLEKPDGVNGALELYSHNMTSTACDDSDGTCYFYIKIVDEVQQIRVFNAFKHPPAYEAANFFYRAAMVQSWNKFCFQGGMLEVRTQLPGAVSSKSGNPDLKLGKSSPVAAGKYYPTWPGIWMMGNLGRAIFSASTNRMWPFSYNRCEPALFEPSNQRISACDDNPGFGLNKNQGRGAPEIDLLEGGGVAISSSLQIAPGMPNDFRLFPALKAFDETNMFCVYTYDCKTPGANFIDVPAAHYQRQRGHKSWYQGLRYAANNLCKVDTTRKQTHEKVAASVARGISENTCSRDTCPASLDVNADLGLIDGIGPDYWSINTNGTCFPVMNSYMGSYLCDADNTHPNCASPRDAATPASGLMKAFNYQMDAISANWPVHLAAYTDYLVYQLEWVTGANGYVRWMLEGHVLFEVSAEAFSNVPQNAGATNVQKVMIEEPMYLIFNVALSRSWGTTPPNPGKPCRGDGKNPEDVRICDEFPMFMKVDYVRLYQDLATDLEAGSYMQVGCDPRSHPTRAWINGHLDEYQDTNNPMVEVAGKAFCTIDDDCTVGGSKAAARRKTGSCENGRCVCSHPRSWGGPRCTVALAEDVSSSSMTKRKYGPPMMVAVGMAALTLLATAVSVWHSVRTANQQQDEAARQKLKGKSTTAAAAVAASPLPSGSRPSQSFQEHQQQPAQARQRHPKTHDQTRYTNYSQNFV